MGLLFNIFPMKQGLFCKISLVQAQILQQKKYGIFFSPRRQAGSGANSRSGFLLLPESGRSRLSPASFPGFVCGQRPEPIRAPGFFFCLNPAARAEPRRPFRSLFTHENNPDILLIGKMFGLFVLTVRIGFNDGK